MNRLTEIYNNEYTLKENDIIHTLEGNNLVKNAITKLGKLEDLIEKYNIKSLKELEKIISQGITYNDFIKSSWSKKGEKTND